MSLSRRVLLKSAGATLLGGCSSTPKTLITGAYPEYSSYCTPGEDCLAVDVHSHIFNGSDLPIDGFIRRVAPAPREITDQLLGKITGTLQQFIHQHAPTGNQELERLKSGASAKVAGREWAGKLTKLLTDMVPGLGNSHYAEMVKTVSQVVLSDRRYAAERLCERYPDVKLFVPALVDFDYWSDHSKPTTSMLDQIHVHSELSRKSMRGELGATDARFHPFVGFNPLKEVREVLGQPGMSSTTYEPFGRMDGRPFSSTPKLDLKQYSGVASDGSTLKGSLALVRYAIERQGFAGVKLYPPTGFLPLGNAFWPHHDQGQLGAKLDLCLRALYAYCEAMDVPIMTHAADSNDYDFGYGKLAQPRGWEAVLDEYPTLRLNLGHFGHAQGSTSDRGVAACESWARQAAALMARADSNVYADMANSPLSIYEEKQAEILQIFSDLFEMYPVVKQRLMYGSDWWMNEMAENTGMSLKVFAKDFGSCISPTERSQLISKNALRYLGFSDPDNKNASRLLAFYRETTDAKNNRVQVPLWLETPAPSLGADPKPPSGATSPESALGK